ncbi:hypothetical protein ACFE04_007714 [Oxalis oulophora]
MIEVSMLSSSSSRFLTIPNPNPNPNPNSLLLNPKPSINKTSSSPSSKTKTFLITAASSNSHTSETLNQTHGMHNKRVFFLDVNPLCYKGNKPTLHPFAHWVSLLFSQVSNTDPVIAVLDGERGGDYRRELLPSYKAQRRQFLRDSNPLRNLSKGYVGRSFEVIKDVLQNCNVPVIKIAGHEADDVVATLVAQVLQKGYKAVIASPDKDFKQLISQDVQLVMPLSDLQRWSFYTIKHYVAQYDCDPHSDLSLRCILGDEIDGVPGIQNVVPEFGRKTAQKLLKKHGSLENLLSAAAVRTVGKPYAQEALTKYADYLRTNYKVLSLKRDVDVQVQEEWLVERDGSNDSIVLSNFSKTLEEQRNLNVPC